jgi:hypothetical protein
LIANCETSWLDAEAICVPGDTPLQIRLGLVSEPLLQSLDGGWSLARCEKFREGMSVEAAHNAPTRQLAWHDDTVRSAAQGHEHAMAERDRFGQAIETLADPIEIAREEGAGFFKAALDRQRDNDGAARATNAKGETAGGRMVPHFNRCAYAIGLAFGKGRHLRRFGLPHVRPRMNGTSAR